MKILSFLLICLSFSAFAGNSASNSKLSKVDVLKSKEASQQQQTYRVTGTITDEQGAGIPGATVRVRGERQATATNSYGTFTITVPNEKAVLLISYVGYITQEITVGQQKNIKIILKEDMTKLDEVVVVGYGTQKKVNVTGAVSSIGEKALIDRPTVNVGQSLQGMVAGLNVTQSGSLGGSLENRPTINIRGIATIGGTSSGSPLILIDGMEGDINAINPNDIENISVLKDAAASSIYGSRAPFGVILITTKKGKAGKTQVSYTSNFKSSSPVLLPKMMDSYTFALFLNAACNNSSQANQFGVDQLQRIQDFQSGKLKTTIPLPASGTTWPDGYGYGNDNVDWFGAIYKKSAPSQEHSLSVNGGTQDLTYFLSSDYLDQTGLMNFGGDAYQRYTVSAKINARLSQWAQLSYSGRFTREDYQKPNSMGTNLNSDLARQGWPTLPLYDPNGYLFSAPSFALGLQNGGRYTTQNDWMYQQIKLTLEPVKGWKIYGELNYKSNDYLNHTDSQQTYNHDINGNPVIYGTGSNVYEGASRTNYVSPNLYTEYGRSFGDHNLKLMVGFQSELNKYRSLYGSRVGIQVPGQPVLDLTSGVAYNGTVTSPTVGSFGGGSYTDWATEGYFGRLNYDYKGRYLIEANLRDDGTSRFREAKQWKYFPSGSIGWNVTQEPFWKNLRKYVTNLKFRGSYGELGNQNTNSLYPTYATMSAASGNSSWLVGGIKQNTASAPNLVSTSTLWETVRTYNGGVDMGFLKNRLTASFDYYQRFTNDMIGPAPELPVILGTAVPQTNNTDLKTQGFEVDVAWQDRLSNGLGYNVHVTLSDSKTTVLNYPNPTGTLGSGYYSGETVGEIWGYTTIGIAKTQADMDAHNAALPNGGQNALGSSWAAGDLMYKDVNGDGKIDNGANTVSNHGDLTVIGNSSPHYNFGVDLSADFKGFDVRAFFQGILKCDYAPATGSSGYYFWGAGSGGVWWSTGLVQQEDYFRNDANPVTNPLGVNLNSYYPRPTFSGKNQQVQTQYLQNAAYIRLKNLQLGYTIPQAITKKIGVEKVRVYVSGENIWTMTKMSTIFDPETANGGYGGNVYPLSKVYSFGVSVNF